MVQRVRNDVLLGDHCDPRFHAKRISVPLLIGHCRDAGRAPEEVALRSRFLNYLPSQILTSGLHRLRRVNDRRLLSRSSAVRT